MSYRLDLDEYSDQKLIDELNRRQKLRNLGLCDYCERDLKSSSCKFLERHAFNAKNTKNGEK